MHATYPGAGAWPGAARGTLRALRDTTRLARHLAAAARPGSVLALVGGLGAGKTTLVQAYAAALGVGRRGSVLSPSYTLVNEHPLPGGGVLLHADLYRLSDVEAAIALGIDEQLRRSDAVVAIEWADHLPELVPAGAAWVRLTLDGKGGERGCEIMHAPAPPWLR